eukprot:SAG31_NODE_4568_length_3129_cov_3.067987_3_plen_69_part_00
MHILKYGMACMAYQCLTCGSWHGVLVNYRILNLDKFSTGTGGGALSASSHTQKFKFSIIAEIAIQLSF